MDGVNHNAEHGKTTIYGFDAPTYGVHPTTVTCRSLATSAKGPAGLFIIDPPMVVLRR